MPDKDRDEYLFMQFKSMFSAWTKNIEDYTHEDKNTIRVKMKKGKFFNSGATYLFGDDGHDNWHLERITR